MRQLLTAVRRANGQLAAAFLTLLTALMPAQAQDEKPARNVSIGIRIQGELAETALKPDSLRDLRPNATQSLSLSLRNNDANAPIAAADVELVGPGEQVLAVAKVEKLKAQDTMPLKFVVAKPAKAVPFVMEGPNNTVQVRFKEKGRKSVAYDLTLRLMHPNEYIDAKAKYDDTAKILTVTVTMNGNVLGEPKCDVKLVPTAWNRQGLPPIIKGNLERTLTKTGKAGAVDLTIEGIDFASENNVRVFLTVDKFARAYEFVPSEHNAGNVPTRSYDENKLAIRFRLPRYYVPAVEKPDPKSEKPEAKPAKNIEVALEIDGPIDQPLIVEHGWNTTGDKKKDQYLPEKMKTAGLRQMGVSKLEAGPGGELLLTTEVNDWKVQLSTQGVDRKEAWFRVGVFKATDGKPVALSGEREALAPFADPNLSESLSRLELSDKYVYAPVIIDSSEPENLRFIKLGKGAKHPMNAKIIVEATADAGLAELKSAKFFAGKLKDNKIPEDAVAGVYNGTTKSWFAVLPGTDKKGAYDLTVVFETKTAQHAALTKTLEIYEVTAGEAADLPTVAVRGITYLGSVANDFRKSDVELTLLAKKIDKKAKKIEEAEVDASKSGDKGAFLFEKVPPGKYRVQGDTKVRGEFYQGSVDVFVNDQGVIVDAQGKPLEGRFQLLLKKIKKKP